MTLAQPPVMTLQGATHSRIIVGQLHTGVGSTLTHSLSFEMSYDGPYIHHSFSCLHYGMGSFYPGLCGRAAT